MNIAKEIEELAVMIDSTQLPETAACLQDFLVHGIPENPYDLATQLRSLDEGKDLPDFLFDFYVNLYLLGINNGEAESMNDLGALYYEGRGRAPNYQKAVRLYELAAINGSRIAQENLGYCYYYGRDVDVNYEKAFHFFLLGALEGSLISLYKIGDMYQNGYYVPKNEIEAFRIYDRCACSLTSETEAFAAGPVYLRLGNCFLNGKGTDADISAAMICYQRAEHFLYNMVKKGDRMYRSSLMAAIEGQNAARTKLMESI